MLRTFTLFLACTILSLSAFANDPKQTPLIPRKILFSNPEKTAPNLSNNGQQLAYIAPVNRVLNIWVAKLHDLKHAKLVTHETKRSITNYFWAENDQYILYTHDHNGDENFHLYRVNLHTGKTKDLTPFPKVRTEIIKTSHEFPNEILVGLNRRNPEWHDIYRLNIITGKLTLVETNNEFTDFIADENLKLRIAQKPTADNSPEVYMKNTTGKWQLYEHIPFADSLTSRFLGCNHAGTIAYKIDSQDRNTAAVYAIDLTTRQKSLLFADEKSDTSEILFHPVTLTPQAYATEYTKINWKITDTQIQNDFTYLKNQLHSDFEIIDRTRTDDKWIIRSYSDTQPSRFYLYERNVKTNAPLKLTFLFTTIPAYENQPLVPMQPLVIKSRDGLDLICYLSLPKTVVLNNQGIPVKPLPMVLDVHGGPWARDSWGLNRTHQWLANRGYAVLSVNYRGSTGLGKAFINAGNMEWAGKMHDDLIDAVTWASNKKIADPQKIAIVGGSYGGFATLVGLTFTPEVFNCGVSIVGPSNLYTLIKTIPPYWKPDIALFKKRVGDIDTAAGREFLKQHSPLTFADRIKKPLLILQGEHDPRVKKAEAEQIVASMKQKNLPVTYVLFHDEGHGFLREQNQMAANAIIEQFLAKNLGGRAEPVGDDFNGANFSIPTRATDLPTMDASKTSKR